MNKHKQRISLSKDHQGHDSNQDKYKNLTYIRFIKLPARKMPQLPENLSCQNENSHSSRLSQCSGLTQPTLQQNTS